VNWKSYDLIFFVDFEYYAPPGELPLVICMVVREFHTGKTVRLWEDELENMAEPPFPMGQNALYVAYYASAEMGCHLVLNWPMPENLLDLFAEFRALTNGSTVPSGYGLLGAMTFFGLDTMDASEKKEMRDLAIRGGPFTQQEKEALLTYCESDVLALDKVFRQMASGLNMEYALIRGQYMKAAACIEFNGVPVDTEMYDLLREFWIDIQDELIMKIDKSYGVFEGRVFKRDKFKQWLIRNNMPWPILPSGEIDLSDDTFKEMARSYPNISPLRELRQSLSGMRLSKLSIGQDGRNRCLLSAFRARTGRNQPSNSKFIYGPSTWLRGLIKPSKGCGIAYVDWSQQEFGIAAALSMDPLMMDAYESGDPYLAFAKQAGAVPPNGDKKSYPQERALFKACVLAVQYGMGADSLSNRIGQPVIVARRLLSLHTETYKVFWNWSDACLDYAMLHGKLWTVFGWPIHVGAKVNPRSLRNFPMQANGAEMLRIACCLASEQGIKVCAPVHDAILIEAPLKDLDTAIHQTQKIMQAASEIVLDGFKLRTDVDVIKYPDRYQDERGKKMWDLVQDIVRKKSCSSAIL
jgi:DNA polymerase family A